jgi:type VI protein secretion system component Hcp
MLHTSIRSVVVAASFVAATLSMAFAPASAQAQNTMVSLNGIKLKSSIKGYETSTRATTLSFGVDSPAVPGGSLGKAQHSPVTFTRSLDSASPVIWNHVLSAKTLKDSRIVMLDGQGRKIVEIVLEYVVIVGYEVSVSSGSAPYESITLSFSKMTYTAFTYNADGSVGPSTSSSWDFALNL